MVLAVVFRLPQRTTKTRFLRAAYFSTSTEPENVTEHSSAGRKLPPERLARSGARCAVLRLRSYLRLLGP